MMATLRAGGTRIVTKNVADAVKDIEERTREEVAKLAEESLKAIVKALQNATSNRLSQVNADANDRGLLHRPVVGVSSGTINNPFAGAFVVIKSRRIHRTGSPRQLIVSVIHSTPDGKNLFDILDAGGSKPRIQNNNPVFPVYEGHVTERATSNAKPDHADPRSVRRVIRAGTVKFKRDEQGNLIYVGIPEGHRLEPTEPRYFYRNVAAYVEEEMLKRLIVARVGKSGVRMGHRLTANEIKISYSERAGQFKIL